MIYLAMRLSAIISRDQNENIWNCNTLYISHDLNSIISKAHLLLLSTKNETSCGNPIESSSRINWNNHAFCEGSNDSIEYTSDGFCLMKVPRKSHDSNQDSTQDLIVNNNCAMFGMSSYERKIIGRSGNFKSCSANSFSMKEVVFQMLNSYF